MPTELDLTSPLQPIRVTAGSDTTFTLGGPEGSPVDMTGWVSTLTIWESADGGVSADGEPIATLTEGDGIETAVGEDSTMTITLPGAATDERRGEVLFYRLVRVVDADQLELMHGPIRVS